MVPSMLQSWISGVWTFNATFTRSGNDVTIGTSNMSDSSINGTSNSFDVLSAVGWLEGWNYRKSHVIENATGAGTGYQVMIHVHKGENDDAGENGYLDDEDCRNDFGDIRFTGGDGTTQLPFWVENVTDGSDARFWVKVAEDLSTENQTIYMYYGNLDETTASSGADTFVYFDDFTGETICDDLTIVEDDTSHAVLYLDTTNNMLVGQRLDSRPYWNFAFAYFPQVEPGYAIRTSCYRHVEAPLANICYVVAFLGYLESMSDYYMGEFSYCHDYSTLDRIGYRFNDNSPATTIYPGVRELDTWQTIDVYWDSDHAELLLDGTSLASTDDPSRIPSDYMYPTIGVEAGDGHGLNEKYFDWFIVRKYVHTEPAHGDWGAEESWLGI